MKNMSKDDEVEEGELPDDDPTPSESINPSKETISIEKTFNTQNYQDPDDSSGEIIFETVTEKDYSPQRKKKKIHKQEVKAKTKEKEKQKADRSSFDREKRTEKRRSPTPNPVQEEPSPPQTREFKHPHPAPISPPFFNPYMYMPPAGMMPHMYPPQYPPMPYPHPPQFNYQGSMPPLPHSLPVPHPHYGMQPPVMYPGYSPAKPMMHPSLKPVIPEGLKFEPPKHHQPEYPNYQLNHPPPLQKYPFPNKIEQPVNYGFQMSPSPYQNNQNQNAKPNQPQVNPTPSQPINPSFNQNRPQTYDKPRQRDKSPNEVLRQKKVDYRLQTKKDIKEALKGLPVEEQGDLLQSIRCILKYSHLSHHLFSAESAMQTNASLNCYENNLSKLQLIFRSQSNPELIEAVEKILSCLQMKEELSKIKQRIIYHKLLNEDQRLLASELRSQLDQRGF